MRTDLNKIKSKALPVLKKEGVTRAALFGSYVRGEERKDSDIDMLVEPPKDMGLFGFVGLQHKLEKALGKKVDLGEYSAIKPLLKSSILREAVQIL